MLRKVVLIFADYYLPGFRAGGPVRSLSALANVLSKEYSFVIVTRNHDINMDSCYEYPTKQEVDLGNSQVIYLAEREINISTFRNLIAKYSPEVVYFNSFFSPKFSILPMLILRYLIKSKCKIVLAPRGEFSKGALAIKGLKKKIFIGFAKLLYKTVVFHATSGQESQDIQYVMGEKFQIVLAKNLKPMPKSFTKPIRKAPGSLRIIFLSRVSRKKNLEQALLFLMACTEGDITFDIYGPIEDISYWEKCKALINKLPKNIHCQYKGEVEPENVYDVFSYYHLFFFPTLGENYGHVIMEALQAGCCVLLSDQTPWNDLAQCDIGDNLSLNEPEKWKLALKKWLLMGQDDYESARKNAYRYVGKINSQEDAINEYKELF